MAFDQRYQPASFRGVPFQVQTNSESGGNLNQHTIFPGKPIPNNSYSQILSQDVTAFSVTGYLAHRDHDINRDNLRTAFEEPEPGILQLPLLGRLMVVIDNYSFTESEDRLGDTIINFTCTKAGALPLAQGMAQTTQLAATIAGTLRRLALESFTRVFSADGPSWVYDSVLTQVTNIAGEHIGNAVEALGLPQSVNRAVEQLIPLIDNPQAMGERILAIGTEIGAGMLTSEQVLSFFTIGMAPAPMQTAIPTSTAEQIDANGFALTQIFDRVLTAEVITRAARVPLESDVQARELLTPILERITQVGLNASPDMFRVLKNAQVTITNNLTERGRNAGRLVTLVPDRFEDFRLLAQDIYNDPTQAANLLSRNRAAFPHPGFIASGSRLEVVLEA